MSNKIEEQKVVEAIQCEDNGKVCDPYDGEQEAYENGLGNEVSGDGSGAALEEVTSNEMTMNIGIGFCGETGEIENEYTEEYVCTYLEEPNNDEKEHTGVVPNIGRGNTNPYMEVYPLDVQPFENVTVAQTTENLFEFQEFAQDGLPTVMQNIIAKYVFIRDTYKFKLSDLSNDSNGGSNNYIINTEAIVEFGNKLIPILEQNITTNSHCTKDAIILLTNEITHFIAADNEFSSRVYSDLFDIIIDKVIPDLNETLISYKEQYKSQMRTLVIPNMVEDVMIHFNSPEDNVDDILEFIAQDCPVAEKYKIVKEDTDKYIVLLFGSENGVATYIPAFYRLTKMTNEDETTFKSYNLISVDSTVDEVHGWLNVYSDSSRWKI